MSWSVVCRLEYSLSDMRPVSRIAVFVILIAPGCSLLCSESDTSTFKLVTDQERYSVSDSIDIALTYTNTSPSPVYMRKCNSEKPVPIVEKRTGVNWKTAYVPACYDPASKAYKTWDGDFPLEDPVVHASNVFHIGS